MSADPRPARRHVASPAEWNELRAQKLGPCRGCDDRPLRLHMTLHHLVGRDLGGDDVADNLIPLCGSGSAGCHGKAEAERDRATLTRIRHSLTPYEAAYVLRKKGEDFLDRYYPEEATC